jgi:hypothetical protein
VVKSIEDTYKKKKIKHVIGAQLRDFNFMVIDLFKQVLIIYRLPNQNDRYGANCCYAQKREKNIHTCV